METGSPGYRVGTADPLTRGDPADWLQALRDGTRAAHQRVESHPVLLPLQSDRLTMAQYRRALAVFLAYFAALEAVLPPWLERFPQADYRYLPRHPLIRRDLMDIGAVLPEGHSGAVPQLISRNHLLGVLYVLEGATQGGRVIAPRLQRRLGLDARRGARYFHLYHAGQWRSFRASLGGAAPRGGLEQALAGARSTFHALEAHLAAANSEQPKESLHGAYRPL
ncbi:biliverdin-producing heme oxygenase [Alkalilimnicola ehrlichii]|uniref:biliverdin-producing heme oxygenase n=1 Tax=Alkalilimnicola ehrlichii TaxID=351052 RepID=UPI003B9E9EBB